MGWDITQGCSPSPTSDEEHQALMLLVECVCNGFWQRGLVKTEGVMRSWMQQGPDSVSGAAGVWQGLFALLAMDKPSAKAAQGPGEH